MSTQRDNRLIERTQGLQDIINAISVTVMALVQSFQGQPLISQEIVKGGKMTLHNTRQIDLN